MGLIDGDECIYDRDGTDFQEVPVQGTTFFNFDQIPGDSIAVNKNYIGIAVQSGIYILSKKHLTEPCLLEGTDTGRVTDMKFFSEDIDQLASISSDGILWVWNISKGKNKELMGSRVIAVKIGGECVQSDNVLCWHCDKDHRLGIAIGRSFLRFDINKVRSKILDIYSGNVSEVTRQSSGVHYVGQHDTELTSLSMYCKNMANIWVSAAKDGTIKLWDEKYTKPIAELRLDKAVISTKFITSPFCSDHIILVTGASSSGSQGQVDVKLWTSSVEDGNLGTNAGELWHCRQTLVLKSSARAEGVPFDQLLAISRLGLLLLVNAKNETVYAIHLEYGHNSAATRMDYITEFTIAMPNLSFTVSSELLSGSKWIVQLYCVQNRVINLYELDFSCCSPPLVESLSVALPAHNTEETVLQFQHFQKTLSRIISLQEGMDKKITKMEDTQKEIQEQIAGQMFFHRPLALVGAEEQNDDLLIQASSYLKEAREILLMTEMTLQQIDGQQ